ncbi:hypothetical protein ACS0TY_017198 [Phlomoides rotata]
MNPTLQVQIDQAIIDLDKTDKKGVVGANAILTVSMVACRAGAPEKEVQKCDPIGEFLHVVLIVPCLSKGIKRLV